MRSNRPKSALKIMIVKEIDIASKRPGNSCHLVLVSDLNLRVFSAARRWEMWSRSVIIDAMLVMIRVVGETSDGAPKTSSRLAKNM